jgi:hypothetical protein
VRNKICAEADGEAIRLSHDLVKKATSIGDFQSHKLHLHFSNSDMQEILVVSSVLSCFSNSCAGLSRVQSCSTSGVFDNKTSYSRIR